MVSQSHRVGSGKGSTIMKADSTTSTTPADDSALVDEALKVTGILPPYDRLVELDGQLRAVISARLLAARAAADRLNRGTREWYSLQSAVDDAARALEGGLGIGLRSAALHVAELARCCHVLRGRQR